MSRRREPLLVKSAVRVFQILEYFDDRQAGALERDIANALDLPQSSTGALLHTMTSLGYLSHDAATGLYAPSDRVPMLGHWVGSDFVRPGPLLDILAELRRKTGLNVALSRRQGGAAQHIFRLLKTERRQDLTPLGALHPLYRSVPGAVFLSRADKAEVDRQMSRAAAEDRRDRISRHSQWLKDVMGAVNQHGYAFARSPTLEGVVLMAAPLPPSRSENELAISLFGEDRDMRRRRDDYARILLDDIAHFEHRKAAPAG